MTVYHLMAIALKKIWCESADTKEHIQRHKVSMYSTKKYERDRDQRERLFTKNKKNPGFFA